MPIPETIPAFWERFNANFGGVERKPFYEASYFGDSEELANSLAELILKRTKRGTAGSLWSFNHEGKRPPQPGDLSIVTNWAGLPLCVIETIKVEVVPFYKVTAKFAAIEGEGDGSLQYWREAHKNYFSRECDRIGKSFNKNMPVVCETFKVVFNGAVGAA